MNKQSNNSSSSSSNKQETNHSSINKNVKIIKSNTVIEIRTYALP
jgi:hypothetical protein